MKEMVFVSKEDILTSIKTLKYLKGEFDERTLDKVIDVILQVPNKAKLYRCGSSVTIPKEVIRYCGNGIKDRATRDVLEHLSAELYKNGVVNIEEIDEPMQDQVRLIAGVYALKLEKEGDEK